MSYAAQPQEKLLRRSNPPSPATLLEDVKPLKVLERDAKIEAFLQDFLVGTFNPQCR